MLFKKLMTKVSKFYSNELKSHSFKTLSSFLPISDCSHVARSQTIATELFNKLDDIQRDFQNFTNRDVVYNTFMSAYMKVQNDQNLPKTCNGTCLDMAKKLAVKIGVLNDKFES